MEYENNNILVEKFPNYISTVTLNMPPLNLMTHAATQELYEALKKLNNDDDVRCIVVCGNRRAFSAGSDIKETKINSLDPIGNKMLKETLTLNLLEFNDKFTIAAIEGIALGGGMELAMACDMRVMSGAAKAGFPEINTGKRPGTACVRLPKLVGTGKALELLLTGRTIDAEECARIGLVNCVAEPDRVVETAMEIAVSMAQKSLQAVKVIRASVREYGFKSSEESFWANLHHCAEIFESDDWLEGLTAFIEKREPDFINFGETKRER